MKVKEVNYNGIIIRPALYTFEEMIENKCKRSYEDKKSFAKYTNESFNVSYADFRIEYMQRYLKESCIQSSIRHYWEQPDRYWYMTFPTGRIVRIQKKKWTETGAEFESRLDKMIEKVANEKSKYGQFCCLMQKMVNQKLKGSYLVYPTTYGVGLWAMYNVNFKKQSEQIEEVLREMGAEYTTEYSEKGWIFRYKLSKSESNKKAIKKRLKDVA